MISTGLAEEPGWRDFAVPRMRRRLGPFRGSLVLGVLWGGWHLPLFLTEWGGWPHVNPLNPIEFVAS
jgi:membrane protease YdiL (CAAX protease family)